MAWNGMGWLERNLPPPTHYGEHGKILLRYGLHCLDGGGLDPYCVRNVGAIVMVDWRRRTTEKIRAWSLRQSVLGAS